MKKIKVFVAIVLITVLTINLIHISSTKDAAHAADESESIQDRLLNGGFEENDLGNSLYKFIDYKEVPYWYTTASDGKIELFSGNSKHHYGNNTAWQFPCEGNVSAELNANEESTLFQIVNTRPGTIEEWGIMHRARYKYGGDNDRDTMAVVIGPAPASDDADTAKILKKAAKGNNDHFKQMITWIKDNNMVNITKLGCNEKFVIYSKPLAESGKFVGSGEMFSLTKDEVRTEKWEVWILSSGRAKWYAYGKQAEFLLSQESYDTDKFGILDEADGTLNYDYTYTVPQNQSKTLFAFVSFDSTSGDSTYGNMLDGIYFQKKFPTLTYGSNGGVTIVEILEDLDSENVIGKYVLSGANNSHFEIIEEGKWVKVTAMPDEGYGFFGAYINDEFFPKSAFDSIGDDNILTIPYEVKESLNIKMLYAKRYTASFDAGGGTYINKPSVDVLFYEEVGNEGTDAQLFTGDHTYYPKDGMFAYVDGQPVSQSTGTPFQIVGANDGWKFFGWMANGKLYPYNLELEYQWDASSESGSFHVSGGDQEAFTVSAESGLLFLAKWRYLQEVLVQTWERTDGETGYNYSGVGGTVSIQSVSGNGSLQDIDSTSEHYLYEDGYRYGYYSDENELVCYTAQPAPSYNFVGWYKVTEDGEELLTENKEYSYYVRSGVCEKVIAKFAPQLTYKEQHYIYKYNAATGEYETTPVPYKEIEKQAGYGETITTFPMSIAGHSYKKGDKNEIISAPLTEQNVILRVYYTQNKQYVKYYPNGGNGAEKTFYYGYNDSIAVKELEATGITPKDGYVFVKWNTNTIGTGTAKAPGDTMYVTSNNSFYAQWATEKTDITVKKVWEDDNNASDKRPESITVTVNTFVDKTETPKTVTLTEDNHWTAVILDVDRYQYDADGNISGDHSYTVTEELGEDSVYFGEASQVLGEYVVTNTYHEMTDVSVNVVWEHEEAPENLRPEQAVIHLFADGVKVGDITLNEANSWNDTFHNLRKYNSDGTEVVYTITQDTISQYTPNTSGSALDGFTVTNTYTPGKQNITVNIVWDDNNNQDGLRPERIRLMIYEVGNDTPAYVELPGVNTSYSFEGDINKEYTFGVEQSFEEYSHVLNNHTITLTHVPFTRDITVNHVWEDDNNRDGVRPSAVTIKLYHGDVLIATQTPANDEPAVFTDLPVYANGTPIVYRVEETVLAYTTVISPTEITKENDEVTVTNTHVTEKIKLRITNTWDDDSNRDKLRGPVTFTVYYKDKNGTEREYGTFTIDSTANTANKDLADVPKYEDGKLLEYYIKVTNVLAGYSSSLTAVTAGGFAQAFKITNSHQPEKVIITGQVIWADENNYDNIRPDSIQVMLYDNQGTLLETRTASRGLNDWEFAFSSVYKYQAGVEIPYVVNISGVSGSYYFVTIDKNGNTVTVLCTHDSLHYDKNCGDTCTGDVPGFQTKDENNQVIVTDKEFVRPGYEFIGWNTRNDGTGDSYAKGSIYTLTDEIDTLYALWQANSDTRYTIRHYLVDENGKITCVDADTEVHYGETEALVTATPKDTYWGYEFNPEISTVSGNIIGDGSLVLNLYYDLVFFNLTIRRENADDETNGIQTFVYLITDENNQTIKVTIFGEGEVTVKGLKKGIYTVTQDNSWSFRYSDSQKRVVLNGSKKVTFDMIAMEQYGLNGVSQRLRNKYQK